MSVAGVEEENTAIRCYFDEKQKFLFYKARKHMLTSLERLYSFYTKEHVILIFPLICSCIYLITLFYPLLYTPVNSGDYYLSE